MYLTTCRVSFGECVEHAATSIWLCASRRRACAMFVASRGPNSGRFRMARRERNRKHTTHGKKASGGKGRSHEIISIRYMHSFMPFEIKNFTSFCLLFLNFFIKNSRIFFSFGFKSRLTALFFTSRWNPSSPQHITAIHNHRRCFNSTPCRLCFFLLQFTPELHLYIIRTFNTVRMSHLHYTHVVYE